MNIEIRAYHTLTITGILNSSENILHVFRHVSLKQNKLYCKHFRKIENSRVTFASITFIIQGVRESVYKSCKMNDTWSCSHFFKRSANWKNILLQNMHLYNYIIYYVKFTRTFIAFNHFKNYHSHVFSPPQLLGNSAIIWVFFKYILFLFFHYQFVLYESLIIL